MMFVGDTRRSGEMHRWMYDRFSLGRLFADAGFVDVATFDAPETSRIEGWAAFHLDTEEERVALQAGLALCRRLGAPNA